MFDVNHLAAPELWEFIGNQVKNGFAEYSLLGGFWVFILNLSRINAKKKIAIEHAREVAERQKELNMLEAQKEAISESIKDSLREQIATLQDDVANLKSQSVADRKAFIKMKAVAMRLAMQLANVGIDVSETLEEINKIPVRLELDGDTETAV